MNSKHSFYDTDQRPNQRRDMRNQSRERFMPSRRDERKRKNSFGENPEQYPRYPENMNQYPSMNFNQMPQQSMMGMNYQGNMANIPGTSMIPNMHPDMVQQMAQNMTQMAPNMTQITPNMTQMTPNMTQQMMTQMMPQLMAQMSMMKNNTMYPMMQNVQDVKKSNWIPTPPPPPSFSECKKKAEAKQKKYPRITKPEVKKETPNVISALLDKKDVRLSSLLEAVMETSGDKVLELEPHVKKNIKNRDQDWRMNQEYIPDAHTSQAEFSGGIDCVIGRRTEYVSLKDSFLPPIQQQQVQQPPIPVYPTEIKQEFVPFKPSYDSERQEIIELPDDSIVLKRQLDSLNYTTMKLKKYQKECDFQRGIIREITSGAPTRKRNESYVLISGVLCFKGNLKHKGKIYVPKEFQLEVLRALHLDKHEFSKTKLLHYYYDYFYCITNDHILKYFVDYVFEECVGCHWIMEGTKPASDEDLSDKKAQQFIESCREKNYPRDKNRNNRTRSSDGNSDKSLRRSFEGNKRRHSKSIDKDKTDRKRSRKCRETRRRSRSIDSKRKRSRHSRSRSRVSKAIKKDETKLEELTNKAEEVDDFPIDLDNLIVVDEYISGDEVEQNSDVLPKTSPKNVDTKEITDEKIDKFLSMMSKMSEMLQTATVKKLRLSIDDIDPLRKINMDTDDFLIESSNLSEVMSFIERDSHPERRKIEKTDQKLDLKQNKGDNYDISEFSDESGGEISLSALEMCANKNQHDMMDLQDNFFDEIDRTSASFKMEGGHLVDCSAQDNDGKDQELTNEKQLEQPSSDIPKEENLETTDQIQLKDIKLSDYLIVSDEFTEYYPTKKINSEEKNFKSPDETSDDSEMPVDKPNEQQIDANPFEENSRENDATKGAQTNLSSMIKLSEFEEASSDDQLDSEGLDSQEENSESIEEKKAEQSYNKPVDFKIRIRNEQIKNPELLNFIKRLDSGVKNLEPYRMKGSMLCKKTVSGIKIVTYQEGIENFCWIVHTMGHIHTPYDRSLFIFRKHFVPFPGIEEIMKNVINNCNDCGSW